MSRKNVQESSIELTGREIPMKMKIVSVFNHMHADVIIIIIIMEYKKVFFLSFFFSEIFTQLFSKLHLLSKTFFFFVSYKNNNFVLQNRFFVNYT